MLKHCRSSRTRGVDMADVCDLAAEQIEAAEELALRLVSERAKSRELTPDGFCKNPRCGDVVSKPTQLFCDQSCSKEYERCKSVG